MTDSEETPDQPRSPDSAPIDETVQKILDEGRQVRARIREVVSGSIQDQEFDASTLGNTARNVMGAAYQRVGDMIENAVPRDSEGALRDVIYGIGDAFGAAARSAGGAFESATKHGKAFATEDVKRVTQELSKISTTLVSSISDAGQSAAGRAAQVAKGTAGHAAKAAEEIKPTVEKALAAAAQHPVEIARDAAKASVDITRQVAGSVFATLGDFMHKAAGAIGDSNKAEEEDQDKP
jgi:hypothetical protein